MDKATLIQAGIDYDQGVTRFAGNYELYEKFLNKFIQDESYLNLLSSMEEKDREKAFMAAHALKGVSGNLSINRLYQAVGELVEILRSSENMQFCDTQLLLDKIIEQYTAAKEAIEEDV